MGGYQYMTSARGVLLAAIFGIGVVLSAPSSLAQVAVAIPPDVLQATLATCVTEEACIAAVQTLVTQLAAANPGVPVSVILGSIAAAISSSYNAGTIAGPVAQVVLTSTSFVASGLGLTEITASLQTAIAAVSAGEPVNLEAIAEGSASPA